MPEVRTDVLLRVQARRRYSEAFPLEVVQQHLDGKSYRGIAGERFDELRSRRSILVARKWKAIAFLERHWEHLMMHHHVKHLPRNNNIAEVFNKRIQRRLKTIQSFQHRTTAIPSMNLLVTYLRFKPYIDCRGNRKHLNGKNLLQAAGLRRAPADWLGTCLRHAEIGNR